MGDVAAQTRSPQTIYASFTIWWERTAGEASDHVADAWYSACDCVGTDGHIWTRRTKQAKETMKTHTCTNSKDALC